MDVLSCFYVGRPFEVDRGFVGRRFRYDLLFLFLCRDVDLLPVAGGHVLGVSAAGINRRVVGVIIPLVSGDVMRA